MLALKKMRLSHQLALMVLLTVMVIIVVQVVYYIKYNSITQDKARIYVDNIMNQIEEKLITSARDIQKISMTVAYDRYMQEYLVSDVPIQRMELYNNIKNSMNYINSISSNVSNIMLIDQKNRTFSLSSTDDYDVLKDLVKKYNFMDKDFTQSIFTSAFKESSNSETYLFAYIVPVFSIAEDAKPKTRIGTCILLNKIEDFQNTIKKISLSENYLFLINDAEGRIIASNRTDLIGTNYDLAVNSNMIVQDSKSTGLKADYIIQERDAEALGFQLISILPVDEVTGDMSSLRNFGVVTAIAMAALMMFISVVFFRNIMRPVSRIAAFLESLNEVHLQKRLHLPEVNEIGVLAEHINTMLSSIDEMTRKIVNTQSSLYEMALSKKQAELSALQSQINPHFLYNTLNCIQSMGLAYGSMEIVNISAALIRIFRYGIKGGEIVKIKDEVESIKDYLNIMSIRYNGKFVTEINFEEPILEMSMVKMVLQPLVENAIYHGLECKRGSGKLIVCGRLEEEGVICFEVIDDGKGMDSQTLEKIIKRLQNDENVENGDDAKDFNSSIGLFNINKRIKLYYGDMYGVEMKSKENEGTSVKIRLPIKDW